MWLRVWRTSWSWSQCRYFLQHNNNISQNAPAAISCTWNTLSQTIVGRGIVSCSIKIDSYNILHRQYSSWKVPNKYGIQTLRQQRSLDLGEQFLSRVVCNSIDMWNIKSFLSRASPNFNLSYQNLLTTRFAGRFFITCSKCFHTNIDHSCFRKANTSKIMSAEFQENPLDELQKFVSVPIISETHQIFCPSNEEITRAQKLFFPDYKSQIKRMKKEEIDLSSCPELLFLGRSNVGKSSVLMKVLSKAEGVVKEGHVSSKPGRTTRLHFFDVGNKLTLVDAPGYGYNMPSQYYDIVEKYLQTRKNLCRCFVLIDGEIGLQKADYVGLNMMEEYQKPYVLVLTKVDKVSLSSLIKNVATIMEYRDKHTMCCLPQPFLISSRTGAGMPLFQSFLAYVTGNLNMKGL